MKGFVKAIVYTVVCVLIFESVQGLVSYGALAVIRAIVGADYASVYYNCINIIGAVADFLCVALLVLFLSKMGRDVRSELSLNPISIRNALACLIAGVAMLVFVNGILTILPIPDQWWADYSDASQNLTEGPFWAQVLFTCLAAPLCEEVVFRGLIYGNCRKNMPMAPAIIIGAAAFGIVHGQFLWISYAMVCGFFMIMAYNNTGSLWGSILMHIGFNGFSQFAPADWDISGPLWLVVSIIVMVGAYVVMTPANIHIKQSEEAQL